MKQRIILLFALLLSTLGAVAQNTNILRLDEVTTDLKSGRVTMPVYMDNADEVVAAEFIMAVPDECYIEKERCALNDDRKADHAISVVEKDVYDGKRFYKVTAYSPLNKALKGNCGKLADIVISVPMHWENGDSYPVELSKVILCKRNGANVVNAEECQNGSIVVNNAPHCDIVPTITGVAPLSIVPGETSVSVSWTVKNLSEEVPAVGGWTTKITITDEDGHSEVLYDNYWSYSRELAAGESVSYTMSAMLPRRTSCFGKAKVTVELTGNESFNEISDDKANNTTSTAYIYTVEKAPIKIETTMSASLNKLKEGDTFTLGINLQDETMPTDMVLNLACDAPSRFRFSKAVTIPANASEATVEVTVNDDDEPAQPLRATFTLTGDNIVATTCIVEVEDDDVPQLSLTFDNNRLAEGETMMATITRTTNIDKKVTVCLYDDNADNEVTYGIEANKEGMRLITLPAGQESVQFAIGAKDNELNEGSRTVNVTAAVWIASCSCGIEAGQVGNVSAKFTIVDNDSPMLTVSGQKSLPEGASMMVKITRNGTAAKAVTLNISSDNDDILEYTKQITMAANATSVTLNIKALANDIAEEDRIVTVTAAAEDYEAGEFSFIVTDERRPDLGVAELNVKNAAPAGATVPVSVVVANEGHGAATAPQQVDILYSNKAMFSANSVKLLTTLKGDKDIAAGATATISGDVTLPAVPGTVYLFARVADNNGISTANNISAAAEVELTAPFTVKTALDATAVNAGGVVTISGTTEGVNNANARANIYYIYNGAQALLKTVVTDAEGKFSFQWVAPSNQPGAYLIGGCYEGSNTPDETVALNVIGLKASYYNKVDKKTVSNSFLYDEVVLGESATGYFTLQNPGNAAIENITYTLKDVPADWTVAFDSEPATIDGGKEVTISYTATPASVTVGKQTMSLEIRSGDLLLLTLKGQLGCVKQEAELVADVNAINTSVERGDNGNGKGKSRDYRLTLTNIGKGNTGKISFTMPDWMTLANAVGSLDRNETAVAVIRITNPEPWKGANTQLTGNIGVTAENGNTLLLPFTVTIAASAKGSVKFDVCDEFTYYNADQPRVQDANIELRNAATGELVAQLATGVYTATVDEGYYNFTVTAPGHDRYQNNILVNPGETTERTVNLSISDNINIDYQIVETEEEDGYEIVTTSTFEAAVPVPQLGFSVPGRIRCDDLAMGESMDIQITFVNQGLVTAKDVTLTLPETTDWTWEAITPSTFDLRPKESSSVFVRIKRVADTNADPCTVLFKADYAWTCGDETKSRTGTATSVIKANCKPVLPAGIGGANGGGGIGGGYSVSVPLVGDDGVVIARVKVQFAQSMAFTRQGFRGTLTVENNSEKAMEDIQLTLTETAPDGSVATRHEFEVTFEETTGFVGEKEGPWNLAPGATGVATVKYLPTVYAAPNGPVDYVFGGSLSFKTDGKERRRELADQVLTVKPTPYLNLNYFLQRNVYADDPLTEETEPAEEAEFAMIIDNVGYGEAKNLKLVTAQPELVDNQNGLLIDFEFTASQLNGQEKSLAVGKDIATEFGTIPAQSQAYAQWWMTSSLLGKFIDYNVAYTHLTDSENPDLSLIGDVKIHELIRSVEIADGVRGFAANDVKDEENVPDVMYLTDGTTSPIFKAADAGMYNGTSAGTYTISVSPNEEGWTYARVADLSKGEWTVKSVKRGDGSVVPARNVWQTWANMEVVGAEPVHEAYIHVLDNISTTTVYTIEMERRAVADIKVVDVYIDDEYYGGFYDDLIKTNEVQNVSGYFNTDIDVNENPQEAFSLTVQGEKVAIPADAIVIDGSGFSIDLTKISHFDGYYSLTINTTKLKNVDGNVGKNTENIGWIEQTGKPVNLVLAYSHQNGGRVKVVSKKYMDEVENYDVPEEPEASYPYGTFLTLKVETNEKGYDFSRWSQNGTILSTEDTYTYYLTAPKELKLFFTPKKFNVTVDVDENKGTVVGGGSGIYEYDEEITLTAAPAQYFVFRGWFEREAAQAASVRSKAKAKENLTKISDDATITIKVDGERSVFPKFIVDGEIEAGDIVDCEIALNKGWTWISSSLVDAKTPKDLMGDVAESDILRFVSQTKELVYDDKFKALVGNLKEISPLSMYKVKLENAATLTHKGCVYLPEDEDVSLVAGYNWLGYLPVVDLPVASALADLDAEEGERLIAKDNFVEYSGGEWRCPDDFLMQAGLGYMYLAKAEKVFQYPMYILPWKVSTAGKTKAETKAVVAENSVVLPAAWTVDGHKYPNNMSLVAQLYVRNTVADLNAYTVAAFVGNECRGLGTIVGDRLFITIHGEKSTDEIAFRVFNNATGEILAANETFCFGEEVDNTFAMPFLLNANTETTGISIAEQNASDADAASFNLAGQKVGATYTGIVVKHGNKMVIKRK